MSSIIYTLELYDMGSYYHAIRSWIYYSFSILTVSITKCENLSVGIFIKVRQTFQSKNMIRYNFG